MRKQQNLGVISILTDSKWPTVVCCALDRTIAFQSPFLNQNQSFVLGSCCSVTGTFYYGGLTDPALWLFSCLSGLALSRWSPRDLPLTFLINSLTHAVSALLVK